jgi:glutamate 5-kinase
MTRKKLLGKVKKVVIKVGTSTLTHKTGLLNFNRIEKLIRSISDLHNQGYEIVVVTSGAIGAGMGKLNLSERPKTLPLKQAVAAVGQVALIHLYQKIFAEYGKVVGQILLTKDDISDRKRYLNGRHTSFALLSQGVIPVVNENDAVVVDEIKVGENDSLSAFVSSLIDADLLIILSDIDGLYDDNPNKNPDAKLIKLVEKIDENIKAVAGDAGSKFGTGGMATKITAAEIATESGTNMIIAHGENPEILEKIIKGEEIGTLFLKKENNVKAKKHWLKYSSKRNGIVVVDGGAEGALLKHKSLLSKGVIRVEGKFEKGDVISIKTEEGKEIAVGISNYSFDEAIKIAGKHSKEIENLLGYKDYDELVHIDNMEIIGG